MKYVDISECCTDDWIARGGKIPEGIEGATLDEKYLQDGKIQGKGFSFAVPERGNNIALCMGQYLAIPYNVAPAYIDFAGFAVFGAFREDFVLCYADGSCDTVKLSHIDVLCKRPKLMAEDREKYCDFGVPILYFPFIKQGMELEGVLFAHRITLKQCKVLTGIRFPENFFVAIGGITLGEKHDL